MSGLRHGRALAAAGCLLVVAALAGAADSRSDRARRIADERAARAARHAAGLARLDFLRGEWTAAIAASGPDGALRERGSERVTIVPSMRDKVLVASVSFDGFGYLLHLSFDADAGRYRITALDDVSGLLDVYEGDFDASGALVVSNAETGTGYVALGRRFQNRQTFAPAADGSFAWTVDVRAEGDTEWRVQTFARLTRSGVTAPSDAPAAEPSPSAPRLAASRLLPAGGPRSPSRL